MRRRIVRTSATPAKPPGLAPPHGHRNASQRVPPPIRSRQGTFLRRLSSIRAGRWALTTICRFAAVALLAVVPVSSAAPAGAAPDLGAELQRVPPTEPAASL